MSIADVQSRTQQIQARLRSLSGGTPLAGGPVGGAAQATGADAPSFASALAAAGSPTTAAGSTTGAQAVAIASQHLGTPYVFGGEAPGGFDCSGLVQWTYDKLGIHLPRTSAEQGRTGTAVSAADARPGDLVYFDHAGPVDHIGIYAGNGSWVVAPHTGSTVRIEKVDLSKATSIRRVTDGAVTAQAAVAPTPVTGSWAAALPAAGQPYAALLQQTGDATGVDPRLLSAVAWTESGFNPSATSGAGAQGLMQLMPRTAEGLGVDALDPAQALRGGATYLSQQLSAFGGRTDLALAAYNAGPTAVRKAGGIPPYQETQQYVQKVLDRYRQLGGTT